MNSSLRVALVHDWLNGMRGGEYVLEALCEIFPNAEIFTLILDQTKITPTILNHQIHVSPLQKIPGGTTHYRHFLPLMPFLIETFDFTGFDLIISSSHCVAKGIRRPSGVPHLSYVHAPMRYMWDRFDDYFGKEKAGAITRTGAKALRPWLQSWDRRTSQASNVDLLVANSQFISSLIKKNYGRDSRVINPFADFSRFSGPRTDHGIYSMVTAFAPNKRVDLAIQAFNELKLPLHIVGGGQEETRLKAMAGSTIQFLGQASNEEVARLLSRSRAFIFPGVDDFGITPVEALAAGVPVIAYAEGGALETVTPETGVFFYEPTAQSLISAVRKIEEREIVIDSEVCRSRAQHFSKARFKAEMQLAINDVLAVPRRSF